MALPSLSIAIMASPPRAARAIALARQLSEEAVEVAASGSFVREPEVSLDREMRGTVLAAADAWACVAGTVSHHLVIQDDVVLCRGFLHGVLSALASRPTDVVSFFVERSYRLAPASGPAWARPRRLIGSQAIAMPSDLAAQAAEFLRSARGEWDDYALDRFVFDRGHGFVVVVPGLVQHDVSEASMVGHANPLVSDCVVDDARGLTWSQAPFLTGASA